ncbi:Rz-like spanin [Vibrio phage pVp-1]|uniref:Outer membrane lipoprotein n=1 Tax=Vibrio phage pVp-1 TaxID=1150989 RepID=H6WXG3_9CAUD|nr:Rz-like spanin [Vibrio phage pVp-1]AFB83929.1 hypothetical protein pVp-1_0072 [Vibrio phage pVp-1]QQO38428.1 hypothetical protein VPG01_070 [Vibrio phage VPG01]
MRRLLLPILLLSGCVSVEPKPENIELQKYIPNKPSPVQTYSVNWKVDSNGNVYLSSTDGVKVNAERKDMIRYIKDLQNIVCYYENSYSFCKENINEK